MVGRAIEHGWKQFLGTLKRSRGKLCDGELIRARQIARPLREARWGQLTTMRISIAALLIGASSGAPAQVGTAPYSDARADNQAGGICARGFQRGFQDNKETCIAVRV